MNTPHFLPYQGSKRKVAGLIIDNIPRERKFKTLYEPFAGSAAFTLHALSHSSMFENAILGEVYKPLADIWQMVLSDPRGLAKQYEHLWEVQSDDQGFNKEHYLKVRSEFNQDEDPAKLMFLIAKCVKNSIRFNSKGEFNQGADNRRKGVHPDKMSINIQSVHQVVAGRTAVYNADYMDLFEMCSSGDLVYCDPPWVGVTNTKNKRYHQQLDIDKFVAGLELLNKKEVDFLVSFDGVRGGQSYSEGLPEHLNLSRVLLDGGLSTQSLLNGVKEHTFESLYMSRSLTEVI
ncbi:Site-specific DNA-methyltransferase (adenine-specific) [Vibrio chagasii]|nr:Site-specific DNA-methyltransferase (adenine-specific) [Vibrio chagasii]